MDSLCGFPWVSWDGEDCGEPFREGHGTILLGLHDVSDAFCTCVALRV